MGEGNVEKSAKTPLFDRSKQVMLLNRPGSWSQSALSDGEVEERTSQGLAVQSGCYVLVSSIQAGRLLYGIRTGGVRRRKKGGSLAATSQTG